MDMAGRDDRSFRRPPRILRVMGILASLIVAAPAAAAAPVVVARQEQAGTTTIVVPSTAGRLDAGDLLAALAQAAQLDVEPWTEAEAWRSVDLREPATRMAIVAISAAMPDVRLRIRQHPPGGDPALWIRLDRDDAQRKVRRLKNSLRQAFGAPAAEYGLVLPNNWEAFPAPRPLVVLVHGYNAAPGSLTGLQKLVMEHQWPCATFRYPNDGPLAESGALLARELARFGRSHPGRRVVLVAHSMGGLVARAAIEDPERDPGNVAALIMVCTPNRGTQWARLPGGLECWEQLHGHRDSRMQGLRASLADGLNEARSDLRPGSAFLRRLNSRGRNPQVRYSLLLGTGSPVRAATSRDVQDRLLGFLGRHSSGRVVLPWVENFVEGLDELERGKGDGVVSVERGRLEGVDDVLLLPVHHCAVTGPSPDAIPTALRSAILDRIGGA